MLIYQLIQMLLGSGMKELYSIINVEQEPRLKMLASGKNFELIIQV
jgi:hypothetical protein